MSNIENIFGERLRLIRQLRNSQTQKEFAVEMGIPQPTLSLYECGKIKPTIDVVINIADKCGVSVDWLCGRDEERNITNLGDVYAFFFELFETNEFSIKTTIHDKPKKTGKDTDDDEYKHWIGLKVYNREHDWNPDITLNQDLCVIIKKAYNLTEDLKSFRRTQDEYDREKQYFINTGVNIPITKIDHSGISEEETRERMREIMLKELEGNK